MTIRKSQQKQRKALDNLRGKASAMLYTLALLISTFFVSCANEFIDTKENTANLNGRKISFSIKLADIKNTDDKDSSKNATRSSQNIDSSLSAKYIGSFSDGNTRSTLGGLTLIGNDNFNEQVTELTVYAIKEGDTTPFFDGIKLVNDGNGNFTYQDPTQAKEWPNDGKAITFYVGTSGVLSRSGTTITTNINTSHDQLYFKSSGMTEGTVNVQLNHLCGAVYYEQSGNITDQDITVDRIRVPFTEGRWQLVKPGSYNANILVILNNGDNITSTKYITGQYTDDDTWIKSITIDKYTSSVNVVAGKKYNVTLNLSDISIEKPNGVIQDELVDGHYAVDMGIPGVRYWGRSNVGASSAFERGDYFLWAGTVPVEPKPNTSEIEWSKCPYVVEMNIWGKPEFSKYTGQRDILDLSDDAASVNWGGNWRMFTEEESSKLLLFECYYVSLRKGTSSEKRNAGLLISNYTGKCLIMVTDPWHFPNYCTSSIAPWDNEDYIYITTYGVKSKSSSKRNNICLIRAVHP